MAEIPLATLPRPSGEHERPVPERPASEYGRTLREQRAAEERVPVVPPSQFVLPAVLSAAASATAIWAYTGVVEPGRWTFVSTALMLVIAAAGALLRWVLRRRSPVLRAAVTVIAQAVIGGLLFCALVAPQTTVMGVPGGETLRVIGSSAARAVGEIANGVAPLRATAALTVLLGLVFGALALLLDQLVAARLVLLTALVVAVVGAVPMIAIGADSVNIGWFLLFGALVLVLFRFAAAHDPRSSRRSALVPATTVGALAVVATLVVAPILPLSSDSAAGGGGASRVSADLRLGNDLRRPNPVPVISLTTDAASPPYLRMATLSRFDGDVWRPDGGDAVPLGEGFGDPGWSEGIDAAESRTRIRVDGVSSSRLPIPYAADEISGAGDEWRAVPENRTVVTEDGNALGTEATVAARSVQPTLEQIRAVDAGGATVGALPDDIPPVIAETAAEVTADADTDYDRLIALQTWFRTQFSYSLDTPVDDGFDGTGADAVAAFLQVRSGYCIHFAGAFALMTRSLDMPVRIVVGYLPGYQTDEERDGEPVYQVDSDQLHSWPEVRFEGIGWVGFEPTATLGTPTAFVSGETTGSDGSAPDAPTATQTPSAEPSAAPTDDGAETGATGSGAESLQTVDALPVMLTIIGILIVLMLPMIVRLVQRALRLRRGAGSLWQEVEATMVDLGMPVSEADTVRERGAQITADTEVAPAGVAALTDAVERASYARAVTVVDPPLRPATTAILRALRAASPRSSRMRALVAPRSLFRRR